MIDAIDWKSYWGFGNGFHWWRELLAIDFMTSNGAEILLNTVDALRTPHDVDEDLNTNKAKSFGYATVT